MSNNIHLQIAKALNKRKSKPLSQNKDDLEARLDDIISEKRDKESSDAMQKNILQLCQHINHLRKSFIHLEESLNATTMPNEDKKQLNTYLEEMINSESLQQIKAILEQVESKKVIDEGEKHIQDLLHYLKDFITKASYLYYLFVLYKVQHPSLPNPYKLAVIKRLADDLHEFLAHFCSHLDNARYIQLMLNHLNLQIITGQKNMTLAQLDLSLDINQDPLKEKLLAYQNQVNTLGNNRILLSIKNDTPLLMQTHMIYHKVNLLKSSLSGIDDINNSKLSQTIKSINQIITDISKDFERHHVLLYNLAKGDYFTHKNYDALYSSAFSLVGIFDPIELFNRIIENAAHYSLEQKINALKFVKNFILADTNNMLISVKPEKSQLMEAVELLCLYMINLDQNETIESLVDEISKIITNKIIIKEQYFAEYLSSISKGLLPQTHLIRRLNLINQEFLSTNNIAQMEEYLIEVNFMLEAPNVIVEEEEKNTKDFLFALEKFCSILSHTPFSNFAKEISKKIDERINKSMRHLSPESEKADEEINPFDLKKLFHEIVHGQIMVAENEKLLHDFFKAIKSGFARRLTMIDLDELRELAWKNNNERMQNHLLPQAIHTRAYYQYFNAIIQFFTLAILCKIEEPQDSISPRTNLLEVKNIYEFIEKAILRALEDGAVATSIAFSTLLDSAPIKRLGLSNGELAHLRKSRLGHFTSQQNFSNSMFSQDILPYLGTIQSQIEKEYLKKTEGEFEKRVLIGNLLRAFEEKKQSLKDSLVKNDLIDQITLFMKKHHFLQNPILKDDLLIRNKKISEFSIKFSNELKPDVYKEYTISEFKSLNKLHEKLIYWYQRMEDFHLTGKNPEKQIMDLVEKLISDDASLHGFKTSLDIINLISQINQSKGRIYKNSDHDLHLVLKSYYTKITQMLKKIVAPSEQLERFFSIFNNDDNVRDFLEKDEKSGASSIPFSQAKQLKNMIENIYAAQKNYNKSIEIYKKSRGQQIYSELLTKVLEGDNKQSLLQFKEDKQGSSKENISLLPESEYPVPQAEPEHPNYIGINLTMNFNPSPYRSTLALFETNELIKDFIHAFPWAVEIRTLNKIDKSKYSSDSNLIAVSGYMPPQLQLLTMNFILLSLDCLGKLTGNDGELAIQNFDKIKMIADKLKEVAELLTSSDDHIIISTKIDHLMFKVFSLNQELLQEAQTQDHVQFNTTMNEFCHINQYLVHKLLGVPFQQTLLSPLELHSEVLEKVSPQVREDLIRYHCVQQ